MLSTQFQQYHYISYIVGYGSTVTEIDVSSAKVFSKECFTMVTPEVEEEMKKHPNRKSVVLFGIMVSAML